MIKTILFLETKKSQAIQLLKDRIERGSPNLVTSGFNSLPSETKCMQSNKRVSNLKLHDFDQAMLQFTNDWTLKQ